MNKIVEKMWRSLRKNMWVTCEKVYTVLQMALENCMLLWRKCILWKVLHEFYRRFYTANLAGFSLFTRRIYTVST